MSPLHWRRANPGDAFGLRGVGKLRGLWNVDSGPAVTIGPKRSLEPAAVPATSGAGVIQSWCWPSRCDWILDVAQFLHAAELDAEPAEEQINGALAAFDVGVAGHGAGRRPVGADEHLDI